MTVEKIELRKILTQMLADNDINKNTILNFVKDIVCEKIDKAVKQITNETNLDELVYNAIKKEISTAIKSEVANKIRSAFSSINVSINIRE